MPLYEYKCRNCQHRFEVIQKFSDPLVQVCPNCGGVVDKLMSSPAIQFKGSGFYITDYAKKDGPSAVKTDSGSDQTSSSEKASEKASGKEASTEKAGASKEKDGGESKKSASEKTAPPKADAGAAKAAASSDSTPKPAKTSD